jgi:beta-lactamase class A
MLRLLAVALFAILAISLAGPARAGMPAPLERLQGELQHLGGRAPGHVAIAVQDLETGYIATYNAGASMPAASTIKIPVMVEVFKQLQEGRFDLNHRVALRGWDRDCGSGGMCGAPGGRSYTVSTLLAKMIDRSDNTATNMLIRLVGRTHINTTMRGLGLRHTALHDAVRSGSSEIRYALRSSPFDMVQLLGEMARNELINEWSSQQMIHILEGQRHNSLLPKPLPRYVSIAHKTGTLHDTLNDVGIVYADQAPYVIAVMTTSLPTLSSGRSFIRSVSAVAYREAIALSRWRDATTAPDAETNW